MNAIPTLDGQHQALASEIAANGIDAKEVRRLREMVFADGLVSREDAALLFHLNELADIGNAPEWYDFFVEALTDYFVWKQEPTQYLSETDCDFLCAAVLHDGRIDNGCEFALLLNVLRWLKVAPQKLVDTALAGLRETVLEGGAVQFGPQRQRRGVIDAADLECIRAVIFAPASDGGLTVTQAEAELLFELHRVTAGKKNAPGWQELFVEAVAHHLMCPTEPSQAPDAAELTRREAWLEERRGTQAFLAGMLKGLVTAGRPATDESEPAPAVASFAREAIDRAEAQWLLQQIDADGAIDDMERALLQHIAATAPRIDDSLLPLLARAGIQVPTGV